MQGNTSKEEADAGSSSTNSLNAGSLVDSFAKHGLICGVIAPHGDTTATVATAAKRADIVMLDWKLSHDDNEGEKAQEILKKILEDDANERLRLIAIYTGEGKLPDIAETIETGLKACGLEFQRKDEGVVLSYRHCRIVIYAKLGTGLPPGLEDRAVSESDLPEKLIGDFACMTEGLLPNIALTSLAAIRENAHKILDRFDAKLDPAFLTHRACLPVPDDSQQHMTVQLANELHAIMEDTTTTDGPAGMEAIEEWWDSSFGQSGNVNFGDSSASRDKVMHLFKCGWEQGKPDSPGLSKGKGFLKLTEGFSKGEDTENQLDRRLAWMINFRTVFNSPPPILQLGTVIQKSVETGERYFLCMRPKCDSVRLDQETPFLLLPLIELSNTENKSKTNTTQTILRMGNDTYKHVIIGVEMNKWRLVNFSPKTETGAVTADKDEAGFYFTDTSNTRFDWLGELKAEFAQRVANDLAAGLSSIAVNNSEWLRRAERLALSDLE